MKQLPNEILDKIFLMSSSRDIRRWESYERLNKTTFLKKKHDIEASKEGNIKALKYLVEQGVKLHANEESPLCWASGNGHLEVVLFLVEMNIDLDVTTALSNACYNSHVEIVEFLVEMGADLHALHGDAFKCACDNGKIGINIPNRSLLNAVCGGNLEVVRFLVEMGADIHEEHEKALLLACLYGHLEVLRFLVEMGADANTPHALSNASYNDHLEVVRFLAEMGATEVAIQRKYIRLT